VLARPDRSFSECLIERFRALIFGTRHNVFLFCDKEAPTTHVRYNSITDFAHATQKIIYHNPCKAKNKTRLMLLPKE